MNCDSSTVFLEEETTLPGVRRVAEWVRKDWELVFEKKPALHRLRRDAQDTGTALPDGQASVFYGTVGYSALLDQLDREGKIDLGRIRGKWEVYLFSVIGSSIVIAGSDKRGTIYGLLRLSEKIGVSPLVNWNHVWPEKKERICFTEQDSFVSKIPSVRYRGFFINDEWPAFGTWAKTHFGGINAACYERVFELLLRLKGNYLWPAMWNSNFSLDGPGLASCELADELGVVMSTSHHEPCMRSGQEYSLVRGKDSVYGDAWDFRTNPEGITRFWRDGLQRNKNFENVITMGMRGENDTPILGEGATLSENIALLRQVLRTQNQLIRETVNPDLRKVPRQIVLFTEVEQFFYGDETVPGLENDPELEGVTLMLSDNNAGAARTLPDESMRHHRGGCGMYYHQDMHGGPGSFEWIGSTYLPKVWEEMTMAWDYGVREIWVTNIGDIGTQEYGLSYFLDLAYDIAAYGGRDDSFLQETGRRDIYPTENSPAASDAEVTVRYTRKWLEKQFGHVFCREGDLDRLEKIVWDYTGLLAKRRHEWMNADTYHPVHYGEAQEICRVSEEIVSQAEALKQVCPEHWKAAYLSLIYFPACGTANLMEMWITAGRNHLFASQNRVEANDLADRLKYFVRRDRQLVDEYHAVDEGYFYGFGLSDHAGFRNWNADGCMFPIREYVFPSEKPRMLVAREDREDFLLGSHWFDKPQVWKDALRPDVKKIRFAIACASEESVSWRIRTDCPWMKFSSLSGTTAGTEHLSLSILREQIHGRVRETFWVEGDAFADKRIEIAVEAEEPEEKDRGNLDGTQTKRVFYEYDGVICMEAAHFAEKHDAAGASFRILKPYGRTGSAIKVFPTTANFEDGAEDRPWVSYRFAAEGGDYILRLYLSPTTPVTFASRQLIGYSLNGEEVRAVNTVKDPTRPFFLSRQWEEEGRNNIKVVECGVHVRSGLNELRLVNYSPAVLAERIVLYHADQGLPESYLGPKESFSREGS